MNLAYNAALRRRYGSTPRPPVRVGPSIVGQWQRATDPSVARLFTPQTPSFPAPAQYRNVGRWQVTFYRTRWYAKLTPFGAPISPGGTAPPPMYFVWVPAPVTLGPRGRFAGVGAGPYAFPVNDGDVDNTGAIAAGSLLNIYVHADAGDQYPPQVTFAGPNGLGAPTGVTQPFGNQTTSPFQFVVTGQPGIINVYWVMNGGMGVHRHALINVQAPQTSPPPPIPIPLPFPLPFPHLPLPVHLPHPPSPVPAPPTGVPAPPHTGAPAPAASTTSTTTYVLLGLGAVAALGLGYWAWRSSQARAPAPAPARRAREAAEAPAAGIDRAKFERCVQDVKARGTAYNPWAVCNASLGRAARRR